MWLSRVPPRVSCLVAVAALQAWRRGGFSVSLAVLRLPEPGV